MGVGVTRIRYPGLLRLLIMLARRREVKSEVAHAKPQRGGFR